jgi:hypothetical protein
MSFRKLPEADSDGKWAQWKVVRLDTSDYVPGEIISADEETGICSMNFKGEKKEYNLGPSAIKIVRRR